VRTESSRRVSRLVGFRGTHILQVGHGRIEERDRPDRQSPVRYEAQGISKVLGIGEGDCSLVLFGRQAYGQRYFCDDPRGAFGVSNRAQLLAGYLADLASTSHYARGNDVVIGVGPDDALQPGQVQD
jgi:hypothetical protein